MSAIAAQIRREFAAFFVSPMAYVLLAAAMIVNGLTFWLIVQFLSDPSAGHGAPMAFLFGQTFFFYLIVLASSSFITMRLVAEEKRAGTLETLLTAPISDLQVVIAKYAAAVGFYITLWIPTGLYVVLLARHSEIDPGPIASGYLGTLSLGMMFLAIGLFFSALTRNQIIAALLSFAANMGFIFASIASWVLSVQSPDSVLGYVSVWEHMADFGRGIVDTRHLVFYGSVVVFTLFCTVQIMQSRRWS